MKQIILAALLVAVSALCYAQVKIAVFGGPQITSAKYTVKGKKQETDNKYGFQIGTTAKVPFENKLYFSPTVFYSLKGYKVKFNQASYLPDTSASNNNTTIHTFEITPLLQYDFSAKAGHFFVKFGPSIDVHLSGNEKFNRSNNTTIDRKMVFSFTKYGRIGANILAHFGYETNGFFISGQYTHGIGSINNADLGPRIWHRAYGISFGKYLGKNK